MNIGDTIILYGTVYTLWLIEDGIYHLIDDAGEGRCYEESILLTLNQ